MKTLQQIALGSLGFIVACSSSSEVASLDDDQDCKFDTCVGVTPDIKDEQGRPPRSEIASHQTPRCFAQDADNLFWMNEDGTIASAPKRGDRKTLVTSRFAIPDQVTVDRCGLALDPSGTALYATLLTSGRLVKLSIDKTIDASGGSTIALGTTGVQFGNVNTPSSVAIDAEAIYVTERDTGAIKKFPKVTIRGSGAIGAPAIDVTTGAELEGVTLGVGGHVAYDLIADADSLYWIDEEGVRKMPKVGGEIQTIGRFEEFNENVRGLSLVRGRVFWRETGALWSASMNGGESLRTPTPDPDQRVGAKVESSDDGTTIKGNGKSEELFEEDLPEFALSLNAMSSFDGWVFFASKTNIYRSDIMTGSTTKLLMYRTGNEDAASSLLFDGTLFFWEAEGTIWSRPLASIPSPPPPTTSDLPVK